MNLKSGLQFEFEPFHTTANLVKLVVARRALDDIHKKIHFIKFYNDYQTKREK